ncbi:MAG TPA: tyrosine-type recombinase/integrase [Jiangellaceae bacterium]|nr:tyrosine-type recombinase/integrase [Jiangellaceae bacterium]
MTSEIPLVTVSGQDYSHTPDAKIVEGDEVFARDHTETWAAAIDGWTNSLKVRQAPTTIRQRRWQLRKLTETYRHRSPWKLTLDDLEAWLGAQDWTAETRKSARSAVRSFYSWAVKTGRTKRNPAAELDRIPVSRHLPRPATDASLMNALDGADDRLTLMLLLAAQAGLRVHEIAKLRWADIIDDEWLLIRGKKDRERRVWMPPRLRATLVDERSRREQGRAGSGFHYGPDMADYVFPGRKGKGMNASWVSEVLSHALPPGTTAHMLRHRAATLGLSETGNLAAVQDFMGHASPETTRIYALVDDDALRKVGNAL